MALMSAPDRPSVTDAMFLLAGEAHGRVHIQVSGSNFLERAVPLAARLGEQMVCRVVLRSDGSGFAGILEQSPRDGDRLFVGYADAELAPTDVVYRGGDPSPRVV